MLSKITFALAVLLLSPALLYGQTSATLAAKSCNLTLSAKTGPDGTTVGWSVQWKRGTVNHGTRATTAPYSRSAVVDSGVYVLTAIWTKGTRVETEQVGTAKCEAALIAIVAPSTPVPVPPPASGSPDGTAVPPATSITDSAGALWILAEELSGVPGVRYVKRNGQYIGVSNPVYGYSLLYSGGAVYLLGADKIWHRWDGSTWVRFGATRPGGSVPVADAKTEPRTLSFAPYRLEYDTVVRGFDLRVVNADGSIAQSVVLGKPPLTAVGDVSVSVPLTLVPGQLYRVAVAACAVECGAYSADVEFVF